MSWTVKWATEAGEELQRVLQASRFKQQLASTALQIDASLASDPTNVGESREGARRILVHSPFVILFEVLEDRQVVLVTEFRYRPRSL